MKRLVFVFAIVLMAAPAFAQDGGGGDGGFGGLFGVGGDTGGRGNNAPPPDRLISLRKILLDASVPLTKDQEKDLSSMLEKSIKTYTTDLEKRFPTEVAAARAASAAPAGGGRGGPGGVAGGAPGGGAPGGAPGGFAGGGGRGGGAPGGAPGAGGPGGGRGGRAGGNGIPPNSPLGMEMTRINAELQNKVTTSLKPEQQKAFVKYQGDQIKKAGGFNALRLIMEEAGAPLTDVQEPLIQAAYTEETQQRAQLMRESQGQPEKAKLDALGLTTIQKVLKVLTADQKKFFLDAMKKQQQ